MSNIDFAEFPFAEFPEHFGEKPVYKVERVVMHAPSYANRTGAYQGEISWIEEKKILIGWEPEDLII